MIFHKSKKIPIKQQTIWKRKLVNLEAEGEEHIN